MRITVRQRVTDYGSASPTVRPVGQTCRTSSVCRPPRGLGVKFATHHRCASPFLHICASLALTQEIFCYLSHLLPTLRPTMWNGLRATLFGVSVRQRHQRPARSPEYLPTPILLNLLATQMFVAQPVRATHRVRGTHPAGPDFTSVTEPTAPGSDGAIENHLLTRTLTRLRPVLPADREIRASSFHHLGGRIQLDNN